jgi:pimeloyl-ACP methyl ester carboxylesterase
VTTDSDAIPVILLSGMAADERHFTSQLAAFPNLRVQPWVAPRPGESLRAYAKRLAPLVDPGRPCIIGGASFGGVVALEAARHVPCRACVLIGSIRTPAALRWWWRVFRPVAPFGPELLGVLAGVAGRAGRNWLSAGTTRRLNRLAHPEAAFVRWAMCAVLRWQPSPPDPRVPVFHIHGSHDPVLPLGRMKPDVVVPGGGHALSLFHPTAVNEFLADVLRTVGHRKV